MAHRERIMADGFCQMCQGPSVGVSLCQSIHYNGLILVFALINLLFVDSQTIRFNALQQGPCLDPVRQYYTYYNKQSCHVHSKCANV